MSIAILISDAFSNTLSMLVCLFIDLSSVAFYSPTRQPMTSTNLPGSSFLGALLLRSSRKFDFVSA
jgi:hypothetical protein